MKPMPKESKSDKQDVDIFKLLAETLEKQKQKRRKELLAPLGIQEFFAEGTVTINKRTCRGLDCNLCTKVCPTNALYWKAGEIGITEELCIFCGACVLSCIVDDCIRITRQRANGEIEIFSKPRDFMMLQHNIDAKKRRTVILDTFRRPKHYLKRKRRRKPKRRKTRRQSPSLKTPMA
jgi:ferredoxin